MNVEDRWTFDSNMLVYAVDADSGEKHETAKQLIWRARELDCVLTIQALCEFYSVVVRKLMLDHEQAMIFVREWISLFRVVGVNERTMLRAMIVANEHQLSFWDSLLLNTAQGAGCTIVISEDMQHLRRILGMRIVNPFASDARAYLAPFFKE